MLASMHDPNQDMVEMDTTEAPHDPEHRIDLRPWLFIVTVAGIGGMIASQPDLAAMAALAGLFAIAHAADLDPRRDTAYRSVAWIVPTMSTAVFILVGWMISTSGYTGRARTLGLVVAGIGGAVSLGAAFRPFATELARSLFGVPTPSRVLRLAARLAILGTLLTIPVGLAFPIIADQMRETGATLVGGIGPLLSNLAGLILLACGGVGLLVRRDFGETARRLGLHRLEPRHALAILAGVVAMLLINAGAEWLQRTWFPSLLASDQKVNQMIAGNLTRSETLLLGLSAGFGEEIALRGALQPKLGIFRTSVLFALLHVQYSWFGMAIIALLGLLLGWIRKRSSTSVAIAVHGLYDVIAVLTVKS
jgi:hypothetical protein